MKRLLKYISIALCIALMTAMAACSGVAGGSSADGSTSGFVPGEPETDTVRLALTPAGNAFNAIAMDQGYLEEEGIKVEYVHIENDAEVLDALTNGRVDVASNQGTNLPLERISEGQDLTIFGGYMLTGCMPVFTKVDTPWTGIKDLVGKTMACEPNLYCITGPLLDMGIDPLKEVKWLPCETQEERIQAVKDGRADYGLVGTYLNYAINNDPELKVCTYASDILPKYSCCRVEATSDWVKENPNTVKALLKAWIRSMSYYDAHHDEAVALMAATLQQDEAFVRAYMDNPHFDLNIGPMKASVVRAWDYMGRLGLLDENAREIDIEDHINVEIYKAALDECQAEHGSENPKFYERMQGQFARYNMD
ncbi:MAG: ABC transporter substrate-binding protein [Mogibacterium sp.]|nr:ABC transporter substrate-binding protein [Mogibacterium sp.]